MLTNKENCALKLVDEIILYYDARSKKYVKSSSSSSSTSSNGSTGRLTICNAGFEVYAAVLVGIQLKGSSNLKTRAIRSFERQENTNSAAQRHLPDDLRHQKCTCLVGAL